MRDGVARNTCNLDLTALVCHDAPMQVGRRQNIVSDAPTGAEIDLAERFLRRAQNHLAHYGLTAKFDDDSMRWVALMDLYNSIPKGTSACLDPRRSHLDASNSAWYGIFRMADDAPVAWAAMRLDIEPDYAAFLREARLFGDWDRKPAPAIETFVLPANTPKISGRVGHNGGAFARQEFRGRDIGGLKLVFFITRMCRAWMMIHWRIDWGTGQLAYEGLVDKKVAKRLYGYSDSVRYSTGYCPPMGDVRDLWLNYISRADIVRQTEAELAMLRDEEDHRA